MKRSTCLALVTAFVSSSAGAYGQSVPGAKSDPAAAQALFAQARSLAKERRYAEACPKFEESLRLDYGMGTEFNLADCNENLGRLASAWSGFLNVAAGAKAKGQVERERVARARASALEPRLPKLVVEVPSPTPGLEVKRDGVILSYASWGVLVPVDPGVHRITATAPGTQTWETTVTATIAKTSRISLPGDLPAAGTLAAAAPPEGVEATPSAITTTMPPAPAAGGDGSAQRTVGWVLGGVGLAGLGVGAGFGLQSLSQKNDAKPFCNRDVCNAVGVALRDDAVRSGNVATVATIAGAGIFVTGLIVLLTAPRKTERAALNSWTAVPQVAASGGGLSVQGIFQ
jgi:hypothetical protein